MIPSEIMHLPERAVIKAGNRADLVVFSGRSFGELLSRPQTDRVVLRGGQAITAEVPDYRLLDDQYGE
jgi:cytosine deaminase